MIARATITRFRAGQPILTYKVAGYAPSSPICGTPWFIYLDGSQDECLVRLLPETYAEYNYWYGHEFIAEITTLKYGAGND